MTTASQKTLPFGEFVALMALTISLVALSIDAMLPALPDIGRELGVARANNNQLIISLLMLGLSIGQMIYGPLSDSTGRKPAVYVGFGIFIGGCVMSLLATSFPVMLAGRILQGVGVAGPRIVAVAVVRDQYEGRAMAQVMSFIMAVFILVPIIAPALGQGLLQVAHWRAIFGAFLLLAIIALAWFSIRQPETLPSERRRPFSVQRILGAIREILFNRVAFGYTIAAGLVSGAFLGYLSSAQQIFGEIYHLGARFPLFFAILALSIGSASFFNGRLVMRYGMRALTGWAIRTLSGLAAICLILFWLLAGGQPPLWLFMGYMLLTFFCVGVLFGNLNALAMEPLGHIAGVGAAVVGSLSTLISVFLGTLVGQAFNGTVLPLVGGFAVLGAAAIVTMYWVER